MPRAPGIRAGGTHRHTPPSAAAGHITSRHAASTHPHHTVAGVGASSCVVRHTRARLQSRLRVSVFRVRERRELEQVVARILDAEKGLLVRHAAPPRAQSLQHMPTRLAHLVVQHFQLFHATERQSGGGERHTCSVFLDVDARREVHDDFVVVEAVDDELTLSDVLDVVTSQHELEKRFRLRNVVCGEVKLGDDVNVIFDAGRRRRNLAVGARKWRGGEAGEPTCASGSGGGDDG